MSVDYLIGVLGGMGPAATVDLMSKVIGLTRTGGDQLHVPLLVSSMPDFPDRSTYLLSGGPSPLPALLDRLQMLEKAGARCIVIPCNTAHYWFSELQAATSALILNLIEEVAEAARQRGFSKVGLLATDATVSTGLYPKALEKNNVECIMLQGPLQKAAMEGIYLYKAGHLEEARQRLATPYRHLQHQKVEAIILGCSEVPLIMAKEIHQKPHYFLDSNQILAEAIVRQYEQQTGKRVRKDQ